MKIQFKNDFSGILKILLNFLNIDYLFLHCMIIALDIEIEI